MEDDDLWIINEVYPDGQLPAESNVEIRDCVLELIDQIATDLDTESEGSSPEIMQLHDSFNFPSTSVSPENRVIDDAPKLREMGPAFNRLFDLTSDLSVLFLHPFVKVWTPDVAACWSIRLQSTKADVVRFLEPGHSEEIIGIFHQLLNCWMRLEGIDPFELKGEYAELIAYFEDFELGSREKSLMQVSSLMLEKMLNLTDRFVARYLLSAVFKTWVNMLHNRITTCNYLREAVTRSYKSAVEQYKLWFDVVLAAEQELASEDLKVLRAIEGNTIHNELKDLVRLDQRSFIHCLYRIPGYLTLRSANRRSAKEKLIDNLEMNPDLLSVDLYNSFRQKRSELENLVSTCSDGRLTCGLRIPDSDAPIPGYYLTEFVKRTPTQIGVQISSYVAVKVKTCLAELYSNERGPVARSSHGPLECQLQLLNSLRSISHDLLEENTSLIQPYHPCGKVCTRIYSTWDFTVNLASQTSEDRDDFFQVAETVLNLIDVFEKLFQKLPQSGQLDFPVGMPGIYKLVNFKDLCELGLFLVAHVFLFWRSRAAERDYVKVVVARIRSCFRSCKQLLARCSQDPTGADLTSLRHLLVLTERIVLRVSYVLDVQVDGSQEKQPFGTLPVDDLFHLDRYSSAHCMQKASNLRGRVVLTLTRLLKVRKRIALFAMLAVFVKENMCNYGSGIPSSYEIVLKQLQLGKGHVGKHLMAIRSQLNYADDADKRYLLGLKHMLQDTVAIVSLIEKQVAYVTYYHKTSTRESRHNTRTEARNNRLATERHTLSGCLPRGEPVWRFLIDYYVKEEFKQEPEHLRKLFLLSTKVKPILSHCESLSQISHIGAAIAALLGAARPEVPKPLQTAAESEPVQLCIVSEPVVVQLARDCAVSCSPGVLNVFKYQFSWFLRMAIRSYVKWKIVSLLRGDAASWSFPIWTEYLSQLTNAIASSDVESSVQLAQFVELLQTGKSFSAYVQFLVNLEESEDPGIRRSNAACKNTPSASDATKPATVSYCASPSSAVSGTSVSKHPAPTHFTVPSLFTLRPTRPATLLSRDPVPPTFSAPSPSIILNQHNVQPHQTHFCPGLPPVRCVTPLKTHRRKSRFDVMPDGSRLPDKYYPSDKSPRLLNEFTSPHSASNIDDIDVGECDPVMISLARKKANAESSMTAFKERLFEKFFEPEFLVGLVHPNSEEDVLRKVTELHWFFENPEYFKGYANDSKIAKRNLRLLTVERALLVVKLDQLSRRPQKSALMRQSAILSDLVITRTLNMNDHSPKDVEMVAMLIEPYLEDLRRRKAELEGEIRSAVDLAYESVRKLTARILSPGGCDWSHCGNSGLLANLKDVAEKCLAVKKEVEDMRELLPRIEQVIMDRDATIVQLERRLIAGFGTQT